MDRCVPHLWTWFLTNFFMKSGNDHDLIMLVKIQTLLTGALTKGDRRAATGADLGEFNFDTPYGRNALRTMYHNICQVSIPVCV